MAEQLKGTKGLLGAAGEFVDGAGEDLLAGAALAGDEDVDVGLGDLAGEVHQLAHVARDEKTITTAGISSRGHSAARFSHAARARLRS